MSSPTHELDQIPLPPPVAEPLPVVPVNPPSYQISSDEYLNALEFGDKTCSLIVAIVSVTGVKRINSSKGMFEVGSAKFKSLEGTFYQLASWRQHANLAPTLFKAGFIYQIDFVEKKSCGVYSDLRQGYEFNVYPSSVVCKIDEIPEIQPDIIPATIENLDSGQTYSFEAFVALPPILMNNLYIGAVVDGEHKIRIQLTNISTPITKYSRYRWIGTYFRGTFDCTDYAEVPGRLNPNDKRLLNTRSPSKHAHG
ncbi:unnamed protein product [Bursaphelenchus xylophilus]|uniref:(pine wood nematode) hypothetical protein n=1 Tax=Bursaphelenchus xylophilus TaxID=6326 RepID=A0A1I7RTW8_BURXY|nr:unnamed protein product [Bursaphelenchus xylophilus]CAG9132133.1 unnamed protein product [Bursaphelenchus xylophilus]